MLGFDNTPKIKDLKNYNQIMVKHFVHVGGKVDNL